MTESGARRAPSAGEPSCGPGGELPEETAAKLSSSLPLVFAGECDLLTAQLARATRGEALVLHCADRARTSGGQSADVIRGRLRTQLQMAAVLTYATGGPVIKLSGIDLPAAGPEPPGRAGRYEARAARLNLVRALGAGGYGNLGQVHGWNRQFVAHSPAPERHTALIDQIDRALAFMRACGLDPARLGAGELFASHESRDPGYDSALTRIDSRTGHRYNTSGHFVWTGAPARDREDQVAYLATIRNPLGVALGPGSDADEAVRLLDRLDPAREPGRMTFQARMGAAALRDRLPALIEKVTAEDHHVVWICDTTPDGPRPLGDVVAEATAFYDIHRALGTHPGGLTAELAGDGSAALELAFAVAELCRRP
ncbi:3-deoxy-7-phosphoheptulonate synthase [Streptomyces sp. NPDC059063]|uniref:3-deoxy-7-phosphoheptulonate synthase n=1 Tax=unclassified Streptomyces TaxID=2593676 RepID=UPI0036C92456